MVIGTYKELFPGRDYGFASIDGFISDEPYAEERAVISYLKNGGKSVAAGTGINEDVFTGEVFGLSETLRDDGDFQWSDTLAYYVEKYNLRLPDEFVAKAVAKYGGDR